MKKFIVVPVSLLAVLTMVVIATAEYTPPSLNTNKNGDGWDIYFLGDKTTDIEKAFIAAYKAVDFSGTIFEFTGKNYFPDGNIPPIWGRSGIDSGLTTDWVGPGGDKSLWDKWDPKSGAVNNGKANDRVPDGLYAYTIELGYVANEFLWALNGVFASDNLLDSIWVWGGDKMVNIYDDIERYERINFENSTQDFGRYELQAIVLNGPDGYFEFDADTKYYLTVFLDNTYKSTGKSPQGFNADIDLEKGAINPNAVTFLTPEPATLVMLGLGMAGLGLGLRRKS